MPFVFRAQYGRGPLALPGRVQYPYNHVTWSLGYEFAFYLMIPAFLVFTKFMDRRIVAVAAALACAYFMPLDHIRMFGLFAGAIIGALDDTQLKRIASRIPLIPTFGCFVGLGIAKAFLSLNYLAYFYSFVLFAAMMLIKIVWDSNNELNRFFSRLWMRRLGTLSYSIYLYHSIVGG